MQFGHDAWGIFEPESGALMARRAVEAVVADVVRQGVRDLREAVAAHRRSRGYCIATVRTSGSASIQAGVYLFACGPWLPKIFPGLLGERIQPTRQEAFFFGAPPGDARFSPPAMPVWIDFSDPRGPYGFPDLEDRGVKIALDRHGPPIDPDTADRLASPARMRLPPRAKSWAKGCRLCATRRCWSRASASTRIPAMAIS